MAPVIKNYGNVGGLGTGNEIFENIDAKIAAFTGGRGISALHREGNLLNINGDQLFNPERESEELTLNEDMAKNGLLGDGLYFIDPQTKRPRYMYAEKKGDEYELFISDPLKTADIKELAGNLAGAKLDTLKMNEVEEPAWYNRLRDFFSTLFGGPGTPEMQRYREYTASRDAVLTKAQHILRSADKLDTAARKYVDNGANKEKDTATKLIDKALSPERLGYKKDSAEFEADKEMFDKFVDEVKEAAGDKRINDFVVALGAKKENGNTLQALYDEYKRQYKDGNGMDVEGMLKEVAGVDVPNLDENLNINKELGNNVDAANINTI